MRPQQKQEWREKVFWVMDKMLEIGADRDADEEAEDSEEEPAG